MDNKIREHLITRLVDRLDRAIPGDTREDIAERYSPAFRRMNESELGSVWERTSASTDAQLYILDEQVYAHVAKRGKSPRIGSDVHLLFQTAIQN